MHYSILMKIKISFSLKNVPQTTLLIFTDRKSCPLTFLIGFIKLSQHNHLTPYSHTPYPFRQTYFNVRSLTLHSAIKRHVELLSLHHTSSWTCIKFPLSVFHHDIDPGRRQRLLSILNPRRTGQTPGASTPRFGVEKYPAVKNLDPRKKISNSLLIQLCGPKATYYIIQNGSRWQIEFTHVPVRKLVQFGDHPQQTFPALRL